MLDTAALSPFLQSIIQNAKSNGKLWVLVVALAIILRRRAVANKPKLVNDLSHVGRAEGQSNSFKDEFDVIIIGGGEFHPLSTLYIWHIPFKQEPLDVFLHLDSQRTRPSGFLFSNPVAG